MLRIFDVLLKIALLCSTTQCAAPRESASMLLTGVRKQVEHLGTAHMILYQIEHAFYPIGGRAGVHTGTGPYLQPRIRILHGSLPAEIF